MTGLLRFADQFAHAQAYTAIQAHRLVNIVDGQPSPKGSPSGVIM
jgi:hypothetical protein